MFLLLHFFLLSVSRCSISSPYQFRLSEERFQERGAPEKRRKGDDLRGGEGWKLILIIYSSSYLNL